ncbi:hypothetical protein ACNKHX_02205 [Shigella flexneri]
MTASLTSAARRMKWRVRQVGHYLWYRFGSSHRVRFVAINFEPVVGKFSGKSMMVRWALSSSYDGACRI